MNTFTQSQFKIDNKVDPSQIICAICALVLALLMLGSAFAGALDRNESSCTIRKVASNPHHPYQLVCAAKEK